MNLFSENSFLCNGCLKIKPLLEKCKGKNNRRCKPCHATYQREKYKLREGTYSPRSCRVRQLKAKFGITLEQYDKLSSQQEHQCAICGATTPGRAKRGITFFCVDHSHVTGKVRGLLCNMCNLALGRFDDNPDLLRRAVVYLENNK